MQIKLDENNLITGYAVAGDLEGSIFVSQVDLPENFKQNFVSGYYKLDDNGAVVVNENYKTPTDETEDDGLPPSNNDMSMGFDLTNNKDIQRMIAMLSSIQKTSVKSGVVSEMLMQQNAQLTKEITQLKQQINGGE